MVQQEQQGKHDGRPWEEREAFQHHGQRHVSSGCFCFLPQSLHLHLKYLKYLLNIYKGLEEFYVTYICTVYIYAYIYIHVYVCVMFFFSFLLLPFLSSFWNHQIIMEMLSSSNHNTGLVTVILQQGFFFFEHLCKYSPSRRYCNVTKIKIIISMQAGFPPNDSSHTFSPEWLTVFTSVKKAADIWLINVNSNCPRGRAEIRPI